MGYRCLIAGFFGGLSVMAAYSVERGPVSSIEGLQRALDASQPGDTVIVADGQYEDWFLEIDVSGSEDVPIVVRPESDSGVTFSGRSGFLITGNWVRLEVFRFANCELELSAVEFRGSRNCSIYGFEFERCRGRRAAVGIKAGASYNRIEACRFSQIEARCINLNINESIATEGIPAGNIIRSNRFEDIPPLNDNGRETIKIGTNQPEFGHVMARTLVEDNEFLRCNGEGEIISNKCSGNVYRRNAFRQCQGELVMRGGSRCLIEDNRMFDCSGGIRLSGTKHVVRNNLIVGSSRTGIRLLYGMTREQGGHYQAAGDCVIERNTIVDAGQVGIFVGDGRDDDWSEKGVRNIPPENNRIAHNAISGSGGDLLFVDSAPRNEIESNFFNRVGEASVSAPGKDAKFGELVFLNPKAGDYRLNESRSGRGALSKGADLAPLKE